MANKTPPTRPRKSEFQLILEFIGFKTILGVGFVISLYLFSGYYNHMQGMPLGRSFTPYYAMQFHNMQSAASSLGESISNFFNQLWSWTLNQFYLMGQAIHQFFRTNIDPIIQEHPLMGFLLFFAAGLGLTVLLFYFAGATIHKIYFWAVPSARGSHSTQNAKKEEIWNFDPRRKPTDEQIKQVTRSLERLVLRAPAMGGSVPKGADISLKELAHRNKDSDYNYRCAVYVMGPVKGTKFDNSYEVPLALDQVKRIANQMGPAASYETLPLDLVILRTKKGTKNVEVDPETAPVNLGKSYPVGALEKIMTTHRNYFIWDQRASKSKTGYGLHPI